MISTVIVALFSYDFPFKTCNVSSHTSEHELIGVIRDGEDVGWSLNPLFASVSFYNH